MTEPDSTADVRPQTKFSDFMFSTWFRLRKGLPFRLKTYIAARGLASAVLSGSVIKTRTKV